MVTDIAGLEKQEAIFRKRRNCGYKSYMDLTWSKCWSSLCDRWSLLRWCGERHPLIEQKAELIYSSDRYALSFELSCLLNGSYKTYIISNDLTMTNYNVGSMSSIWFWRLILVIAWVHNNNIISYYDYKSMWFQFNLDLVLMILVLHRSDRLGQTLWQ